MSSLPRRVLCTALLAAVGVAATTACRRSTTARLGLPPPVPVAELDLAAYMGTWFEIARFDERFQRGCLASQATYTLQDDGLVEVVNSCRREHLDGPSRTVRGRARRPDAAAPGKLEVNFFGPFWADYWVLEVGAGMSHAVVGHPSRDHLWILSRTPDMAPALYQGIVARLEAMGFATQSLEVTPQPAPPDGAHRAAGEGTSS